ncbi:ribosome small subunit-dependent GTPase A [Anaerococcus sp.]|uniref:ribosome small subunit-dependent GTPase A n=1 Tax=Anaerococcus sp. TaxID=1872515 RepID=UPI002904D4AC|nr:ribosome small subunit-dependent GTPase A [Anaerococcus sp.]MDU1828516.1 ribosome small subunit-dependent GTPase A [Anaerococcus sp.]MDU1865047.1 ribosome small subunit-dependent GTPase A [Anaerococcus sp.]
MNGKIIKSQKELYYVETSENIFMCKARGNFRKRGIKPLVGDNALIEIQEEDKAYIIEILERKNEIKRPNIANIDQMLIFVTINDPPLNLYNLDKYLAMCEHENIDVVIILSKKDLAKYNKIKELTKIYENLDYKVLSLDNYNDFPKKDITEILEGKTSAVSGASGVGKSTFLNNLVDKDLEIGEISDKLKRGKNTTRHTEIFSINPQTYIFDTPGFDSFDFDFIEDENNLKYCFREMSISNCRFNNCNHINEPNCSVKEKVENGDIAKSRYDNYVLLFKELKERRENKW